MISPWLGMNQNVRKVPDRSRTMKLHSAISPSRNDQWSGKTLRPNVLTRVARRTSSSSHFTGPAAALPVLVSWIGFEAVDWSLIVVSPQLREARAHLILEVAHRDQVAL